MVGGRMVQENSTNRVLIIDDDPDLRDFLADVAESLGMTVLAADEPADFLECYRSFQPNVILLDLMMPQVDGIQVLEALGAEKCASEILLMSGADSKVLNSTARFAEAQGLTVRDCLRKPIALDDLESALQSQQSTPFEITEETLKRAIENGEITAFYQPKINVCSDVEWDILGVEALARWVHPEHGLIPPIDFIPLAETTGLIDPLTEVIVSTALSQAQRLSELGLEIDVAVNVSGALMADPSFPDKLSELLKANEVAASRLIVEITESVALSESTAAIADLTRFRLKGMRLAMDDFGTGYSSLIQLHRMPFSELKIDMSFVQELGKGSDAEVIVRSIVDLGHNLGLSVCAEGVETRFALDFLKSLGCDQAQGFFISKALPENDLLEFMNKNQGASLKSVAKTMQRESAAGTTSVGSPDVSSKALG